MSYTAVGKNKVYASIEDLPENQKLVNGDRILIQTDDGTALVDYENIKIDLNHVTFGTQISQLVEFTATVEQFVQQIQTDFDAIQEETANMKISISELQDKMECCKLLFQHIMGSVAGESSKFIESQVQSTLKGTGLEMY
jgi:hypothetical protein